MTSGQISNSAAVRNLFGTRDQFHGGQFIHRQGGGGAGSGGNESDGERQRKLRSLDHHSPPAVRPGGWGPLQ